MITGSVSNGCQLLCQLYHYHPTNTHRTSPQNWVVALRKPSEITLLHESSRLLRMHLLLDYMVSFIYSVSENAVALSI